MLQAPALCSGCTPPAKWTLNLAACSAAEAHCTLACRVCGLNGQVATTPEGRAWNPVAPKTGDTANAALLAAIYGQLTSPFITAAQSDRYICFARGQMRYMLGDKGQSLMVGYGSKSPTHAQVHAAAGSRLLLAGAWSCQHRQRTGCSCRLLQPARAAA